MNQYQKQNAIDRVNGYYFPRPSEQCLGREIEAFERAKAETIKNLRNYIEETEALVFDDFIRGKR